MQHESVAKKGWCRGWMPLLNNNCLRRRKRRLLGHPPSKNRPTESFLSCVFRRRSRVALRAYPSTSLPPLPYRRCRHRLLSEKHDSGHHMQITSCGGRRSRNARQNPGMSKALAPTYRAMGRRFALRRLTSCFAAAGSARRGRRPARSDDEPRGQEGGPPGQERGNAMDQPPADPTGRSAADVGVGHPARVACGVGERSAPASQLRGRRGTLRRVRSLHRFSSILATSEVIPSRARGVGYYPPRTPFPGGLMKLALARFGLVLSLATGCTAEAPPASNSGGFGRRRPLRNGRSGRIGRRQRGHRRYRGRPGNRRRRGRLRRRRGLGRQRRECRIGRLGRLRWLGRRRTRPRRRRASGRWPPPRLRQPRGRPSRRRRRSRRPGPHASGGFRIPSP